MSRHKITTDELSILLGWDPPLSTYFAQVWEKEHDPDNDIREYDPPLNEPEPLLCIGTNRAEVPTVETLAEHLKPYVAIPEQLAERLRAERKQSPVLEWQGWEQEHEQDYEIER